MCTQARGPEAASLYLVMTTSAEGERASAAQRHTVEGEPVPILARGHLLDRDDVLASVELCLRIDALRCRHDPRQRLDLKTGAHALAVDVHGKAGAIARFADVEREFDGAVDAEGERAGVSSMAQRRPDARIRVSRARERTGVDRVTQACLVLPIARVRQANFGAVVIRVCSMSADRKRAATHRCTRRTDTAVSAQRTQTRR